MVICEYDRLVARKGKFPEVVATKRFKADSIRSAIYVLVRWNSLGRIKNKIVKVDWIYCIKAITKATLQDLDNIDIPFFKEGSC
jgi:hypothetical protein